LGHGSAGGLVEVGCGDGETPTAPRIPRESRENKR